MWLVLACTSPEPVDAPVVSAVPYGANSLAFDVVLPELLPLAVVCTSSADPDERHELVLPVNDHHEGGVFGLLAGTPYDCTFSAGDWSEQRAIATGPLPDWVPTWTLDAAPGAGAGGAYTLFSHGTDTKGDRRPSLLIVDPEGRARWTFKDPGGEATDLDAQYVDGEILYGGGYAVAPTRIDLFGNIVAEAGESSTRGSYNHHVEQIPSGEVLTIAVADNTDGEQTWTGFVVDTLTEDLGRLLSSWDSQRGVDEGWLPPKTVVGDPYHANALFVDGSDLWLNLRSLSWMAVIDRDTGLFRYLLGSGKDFEMVDANGDPDPGAWFHKPHAPEKHGERLFVYDNGDPLRPQTYVSEYAVDEASRTIRRVWAYTEPDWYEPIWGDVDLLPGEHVLVVRAHCDTCGADPAHRMQILEIDRASDAVVWRMVFDDPDSGGYRAARIDGCDLFANRRYCPSP